MVGADALYTLVWYLITGLTFGTFYALIGGHILQADITECVPTREHLRNMFLWRICFCADWTFQVVTKLNTTCCHNV